MSEVQKRSGFGALVITQLQLAFNDNAYKNLVIVLVVSMAATPRQEKALVAAITAVFMMPFLVFSLYGGAIADRFSKRGVAIGMKLLEIAWMLAAVAGLMFNQLWICIAVLAVSGVQASIFGPAKYGMIPELLPENRIPWANGVIESVTFTAIITGTWCGALLFELFRGKLWLAVLILAVLSAGGALMACRIRRIAAAAPEKPLRLNVFSDLRGTLAYVRRDATLWRALLGNAYFWSMAGLVYMNVVSYSHETLGERPELLRYPLVALAAGIGLGCITAGILSRGRIRYGFILFGAAAMSCMSVVLALPGIRFGPAIMALAVLGFCGGFYAVPVQALVQERPGAHYRGRVQGLAFFLSNSGVVLTVVIYAALTLAARLNPCQVFMAAGALNLLVTIVIAASHISRPHLLS
ncbi:MAG: MFS transporter [Candidatus Sumerlaeota bacterium]|nr:MFS transporter [Candidatus Sumerlaeota bacterium]